MPAFHAVISICTSSQSHSSQPYAPSEKQPLSHRLQIPCVSHVIGPYVGSSTLWPPFTRQSLKLSMRVQRLAPLLPLPVASSVITMPPCWICWHQSPTIHHLRHIQLSLVLPQKQSRRLSPDPACPIQYWTNCQSVAAAYYPSHVLLSIELPQILSHGPIISRFCKSHTQPLVCLPDSACVWHCSQLHSRLSQDPAFHACGYRQDGIVTLADATACQITNLLRHCFKICERLLHDSLP